MLEMYAPDSIKVDESGNCTAMCLRPQMAGAIDRSGRPSPVDAPAPIMELACDIVVVAIGQNIQWNTLPIMVFHAIAVLSWQVMIPSSMMQMVYFPAVTV